MTQILTVRSAFPARRYRQEELTRAVADRAGLNGTRRTLLERLHRNAGVDTRHTALPLEEYRKLDGVGAANDRYIDEATALGERALRAALDAAGIRSGDLDLLIVTSVTGVAVPSLDARLIPRLGLRPDIKRLPVFGLGCVAGAAALSRLHDYLLGWPGHTAALLAVELCSLTWPGDLATADLVATGLFGDGAVALVAAGDSAGGERHKTARPTVISTRSEVYPDSGDTLGWRLGRDGFGIVLTADLSDVVERRLGETVTSFLAERGLTTDDITTWICHPGGPKVLDAVRKSLKLPDEALAASWKSLAEVGNLSSASVLHILEQTMTEPGPPGHGQTAGRAEDNGAFGLMIGLGPGVSAELVLLRW
ncbi:MAG TPA: 3-oxoacyl-[acyl-carrier-protein] synthase III C-terminal domain-containing protein [Trebonia sp.]|jgi:alkylresorcinol/alkylpyrone synthase